MLAYERDEPFATVLVADVLDEQHEKDIVLVLAGVHTAGSSSQDAHKEE